MSEAHCNKLPQRKALGLVTHDNTGGPFVVECQGCGEVYPSFHCLGGGQIADTGDYEDARCPHCDQIDPEECDNAALAWNIQQLKINELQQRLNAADQRIDELTQRKDEPVEWGAPKTVRQLIRQLETLDQDLRPLSMLRVPGDVFEDGKERTRAVHLSFSHERVEGQWLAPFKGDGEKVVAFWCRMEPPAPVAVEITDRSPEDYAIEHAEYMAKSADDVLAKFQAYGLALMAVDEGGDDGEGELFEAIDSTRQDLQESLVDLRGMVYEFRKRSNRCTPL